jgi:hypothetical protein
MTGYQDSGGGKMATDIGWTALAWPGLEHVIVSQDADGFRAQGQLVLAEEGLCSVRYQLTCDAGWRFRHLTIGVTSANADERLSLVAGADGHWLADGQRRPDLDDCIGIDINCTPLTNTLPIRRLDWSRSGSYDLRVAYVSVPELEVRPAWQRYTQRDNGGQGQPAFRYESRSFQADLSVDAGGFVVDYPGLWRRVSADQTAAA